MALVTVLGVIAVAMGAAVAWTEAGQAAEPSTDSWARVQELRRENQWLRAFVEADVSRAQVDAILTTLQELREDLSARQDEMVRLLEQQREAIVEGQDDRAKEYDRSIQQAAGDLRERLQDAWRKASDALTAEQRSKLQKLLPWPGDDGRVVLRSREIEIVPKGMRNLPKGSWSWQLPRPGLRMEIAPKLWERRGFRLPPMPELYATVAMPGLAGLKGLDRLIEVLEAVRDAMPAAGA